MPQKSFGSNNDVSIILDAGPDGAFVALQVLDNSTLFFDKTKESLLTAGAGAAAPNLTQGFQLLKANGVFTTWWTGKMWGRSDTVQGLINAAVIFQARKGKCGCGSGKCGGGDDPANPQPGFDEG
jgi:hypothetical protein